MKEKFLVVCKITLVIALLSCLFCFIVYPDWSKEKVETASPSREAVMEDLTENTVIRQTFVCAADHLNAVRLDANLWGAPADQPVTISILKTDEVLESWDILPGTLEANALTTIPLPKPVNGLNGTELTLELPAHGGMSFWKGTGISATRFTAQFEPLGILTVNDQKTEGSLVFRQIGTNDKDTMKWYWPVVGIIWLVCVGIFLYSRYKQEHGQRSILALLNNLYHRYFYLLKTLVIRDFRVKYQASMLGMVWSLLNPLLTTGVYYFVFNTLFHSDIENFVAYLMSGIIMFNYFTESTNLGLYAIIGNASLITKVYVPKFIYPLSKVLSSAINLVISLVPLTIIMLLSGVQFHRSILLLPLALLFLIVFCVGVSLVLSALTVFFRDVQFLWGVLVTLWNFLTPIFYPETIIPLSVRPLYHLNPMYQYITFLRTITIGGASPSPMSFALCIGISLATFGIGYLIFRRLQDRFVLYL